MATARVLIVDDEPAVLELTAYLLRDAGYEVIKAPSGEDALHLVRTSPPVDLLLSDVKMPGMKGPALIEAVKRDSPSTAVMLMSAFTESAPPSGVPFLSKPFSPAKLVAMVEEVLAASAQAREALARALDRAQELQAESKLLVSETEDVIQAVLERRRRQGENTPGPEEPK